MMERKLWLNIDYNICLNCFNCKTKLDEIYCIKGHFKEKKTKQITYIPQDFDCSEYDG